MVLQSRERAQDKDGSPIPPPLTPKILSSSVSPVGWGEQGSLCSMMGVSPPAQLGEGPPYTPRHHGAACDQRSGTASCAPA